MTAIPRPMQSLPCDPNRAGQAARRSVFSGPAEIVLHEAVASGYRRIELRMPGDAMRPRPGQFYQILCPQTGECHPFLRRPMSVYVFEEDGSHLIFLYKVAGCGTASMAELAPGETLDVLGPLGVGFALPEPGTPFVVLARGAGLATLAPLVAAGREAGHDVTAILSARSPELVLSAEAMSRHGASVVRVTDAEGTSDVPNVVSILEALRHEGRAGAIYTCGSNRLMLAAQDFARRHGLPGEVALEQQMACGVGVCLCCVRAFRDGDGRVTHRRVCTDGPVFPLGQAMPW